MVDPSRASWAYQNPYAFVVAEGRPYDSAPLSPDERRFALNIAKLTRYWYGPFEYRRCFMNAQQALVQDRSGRLVYVEGYIFVGQLEIPHEHAWLSLGGKVIDFTGAPTDVNNIPPEPPVILGEFTERAYYGVPFRREYVKRRIRTLGGFGSLLEDGERDDALFRGLDVGWRRKR